jgi:hypothetical protein
MWGHMSRRVYRSAAPGGTRATDLPDPDAILGRVSARAKGLFTAEGALVAALLVLLLGIVPAVFHA